MVVVGGGWWMGWIVSNQGMRIDGWVGWLVNMGKSKKGWCEWVRE